MDGRLAKFGLRSIFLNTVSEPGSAGGESEAAPEMQTWNK